MIYWYGHFALIKWYVIDDKKKKKTVIGKQNDQLDLTCRLTETDGKWLAEVNYLTKCNTGQ